MKINKKLSKLKLSLLASFVVLLGSSSVFASSVPTCTQNTKINISNFRMNKAKCNIPGLCKKDATCKTSEACKASKACKVTKAVKVPTAVEAPASVKAPVATPTPVKPPVAAPAPVTTPIAQPTTPTPAPTAPTTPTAPISSVSAYENQVLTLVNVERQKAGLKPLQMDAAISNVARMKSADMQAKNYFSHTSPTYGSPFDMMKQFGITYRTAGENIAMGQKTPEAVVTAWMNSPGHKANILKADFTHIGVGYVATGSYWTQMFIGK